MIVLLGLPLGQVMGVTVVPKSDRVRDTGPHSSPVSLIKVMTHERYGSLTQLRIMCTPGLFTPQ